MKFVLITVNLLACFALDEAVLKSNLHDYVHLQTNKVAEIQQQVKAMKQNLDLELQKAEQLTAKGQHCGGVDGKACSHVEDLSNACSFARVGAEFAYQEVNKIVNGLGKVVTGMCGCIMVQKVTVCALAAIPEVCTFPYAGYSALWAASVQMWETVKATTNSCKVVGHPSVASQR